ncbi:uncharacterized protein L969DRAFT_88923 [Mixia osmundae IAM 14324]|uniref:Uncharacterized protein n=1 Tax=Mixia osmundae (strain CBS 9802 / IAM 14324 / JCM 22182 / KY 12970) TaxID=764103 RepID=G7E7S2_MIXOS|nr:uncharacterized protein L969DRAFT_88923 [Mixia osmundae IAM 14324]KEI38482.1 hypothetical protein L969DRAFT_88923 [Mixia osmundae IAM 14324]GAA98882.1 hypothetical protein E5Q_05570 [Mixia osmundae IAM 14324]
MSKTHYADLSAGHGVANGKLRPNDVFEPVGREELPPVFVPGRSSSLSGSSDGRTRQTSQSSSAASSVYEGISRRTSTSSASSMQSRNSKSSGSLHRLSRRGSSSSSSLNSSASVSDPALSSPRSVKRSKSVRHARKVAKELERQHRAGFTGLPPTTSMDSIAALLMSPDSATESPDIARPATITRTESDSTIVPRMTSREASPALPETVNPAADVFDDVSLPDEPERAPSRGSLDSSASVLTGSLVNEQLADTPVPVAENESAVVLSGQLLPSPVKVALPVLAVDAPMSEDMSPKDVAESMEHGSTNGMLTPSIDIVPARSISPDQSYFDAVQSPPPSQAVSPFEVFFSPPLEQPSFPSQTSPTGSVRDDVKPPSLSPMPSPRLPGALVTSPAVDETTEVSVQPDAAETAHAAAAAPAAVPRMNYAEVFRLCLEEHPKSASIPTRPFEQPERATMTAEDAQIDHRALAFRTIDFDSLARPDIVLPPTENLPAAMPTSSPQHVVGEICSYESLVCPMILPPQQACAQQPRIAYTMPSCVANICNYESLACPPILSPLDACVIPNSKASEGKTADLPTVKTCSYESLACPPILPPLESCVSPPKVAKELDSRILALKTCTYDSLACPAILPPKEPVVKPVTQSQAPRVLAIKSCSYESSAAPPILSPCEPCKSSSTIADQPPCVTTTPDSAVSLSPIAAKADLLPTSEVGLIDEVAIITGGMLGVEPTVFQHIPVDEVQEVEQSPPQAEQTAAAVSAMMAALTPHVETATGDPSLHEIAGHHSDKELMTEPLSLSDNTARALADGLHVSPEFFQNMSSKPVESVTSSDGDDATTSASSTDGSVSTLTDPVDIAESTEKDDAAAKPVDSIENAPVPSLCRTVNANKLETNGALDEAVARHEAFSGQYAASSGFPASPGNSLSREVEQSNTISSPSTAQDGIVHAVESSVLITEDHLQPTEPDESMARAEVAETANARTAALQFTKDLSSLHQPGIEQPASASAVDSSNPSTGLSNGHAIIQNLAGLDQPGMELPSEAREAQSGALARQTGGMTSGGSQPPREPPSLTLSLFTGQIKPWRRQILALLATLGINLALPFINGIMVGFGEIVAREYLAPSVYSAITAWRSGTTYASANLGMRAAHGASDTGYIHGKPGHAGSKTVLEEVVT